MKFNLLIRVEGWRSGDGGWGSVSPWYLNIYSKRMLMLTHQRPTELPKYKRPIYPRATNALTIQYIYPGATDYLGLICALIMDFLGVIH